MAAKNGRAAAPPVERLDAIGDSGRAQLAARMIAQLQEQAEIVQMTRIANAHSDEDFAPGTVGAGGEPITYAARIAQLEEAQDRLLGAYAGARPAIEAAVEALQQQQGAQ